MTKTQLMVINSLSVWIFIPTLHTFYFISGNLHAGNIFITSDGCPIISETEMFFTGSSSNLRPFIVQLKGPCSSVEALDVYCFGHLLYEMAAGSPLQNPTCDNALPNQISDQLSKCLKLCNNLSTY